MALADRIRVDVLLLEIFQFQFLAEEREVFGERRDLGFQFLDDGLGGNVSVRGDLLQSPSGQVDAWPDQRGYNSWYFVSMSNCVYSAWFGCKNRESDGVFGSDSFLGRR